MFCAGLADFRTARCDADLPEAIELLAASALKGSAKRLQRCRLDAPKTHSGMPGLACGVVVALTDICTLLFYFSLAALVLPWARASLRRVFRSSL